jgi:hypothetical protein
VTLTSAISLKEVNVGSERRKEKICDFFSSRTNYLLPFPERQARQKEKKNTY